MTTTFPYFIRFHSKEFSLPVQFGTVTQSIGNIWKTFSNYPTLENCLKCARFSLVSVTVNLFSLSLGGSGKTLTKLFSGTRFSWHNNLHFWTTSEILRKQFSLNQVFDTLHTSCYIRSNFWDQDQEISSLYKQQNLLSLVSIAIIWKYFFFRIYFNSWPIFPNFLYERYIFRYRKITLIQRVSHLFKNSPIYLAAVKSWKQQLISKCWNILWTFDPSTTGITNSRQKCSVTSQASSKAPVNISMHQKFN